MEEVAELLNRMVKEGAILDYAVFGAVAQMRYTEAVATFDAAIKEAETADLEGTYIRVVRADYLAVIALSVGRAKDFARVLALREVSAVEDDQIAALAGRHGLADAWRRFLERFDEA